MTKNKQPIIEASEVEHNPIGLKESTVQGIQERLDSLVASLFVQFHQYQKHHWVIEGPQHRDLHLYFEEAYHATHKELDAIAERMTVLGCVPVSSPTEQVRKSFIEHEPEGVFSVRDMLQADLDNERLLAGKFRDAIRVAMDLEDFGTETLLKGTLLNVEERAHNLDHYLSGFSLENGRERPS